ncbi:MAG: divalent cation tolerance protein CutA [Candidatus Aenigmarchaeota archaeon]|nr:divalent cation tolerance protein CutA [Candidatus Aenigmarchaeota archaeon]
MYIVVFITCPDIKEAKKVSDVLLGERMAACVNIIPNLKSYFWWTGKIHNANEVLIVAKTKQKLLRKLVKTVKNNHQYENPEIIALPIVGGSKDYIQWIEEETL